MFGSGNHKGDGADFIYGEDDNIIATEDMSDSVDLWFVVVTAALRRGRRAFRFTPDWK